jgi:hypothetical protein
MMRKYSEYKDVSWYEYTKEIFLMRINQIINWLKLAMLHIIKQECGKVRLVIANIEE